ncbi:MAG: DUF5723 family protein [Bacteroidales bacterium]
MHNFKKYSGLITGMLLISSVAIAQQGQTFYHMNRVSQTTYMNPSVNSDYDLTIGGLLLPVVGQVPPTMYMNISSNGFQYNDFIHHGTGDQSDSLVYDPQNLLDKMKTTNHIQMQTHIDLVHVGIKTKNDVYLTFNITEKIDAGISLPKDLFELAWYGNGYFKDQNEKVVLTDLGFHFSHYREIAGGFSTELMDDFHIGGRAKILFGMSNVQTDIDELTLYTHPDDYTITTNANMSIQTNSPVDWEYYHEGDSISIEPDFPDMDTYNPLSYAFNFSNPGFGIDLGASYTFLNDFTAYFSVNDLGFISWNSNPFVLSSDGTFNFRGIEVDFFESDEEFEESMEEFEDSVINIFAPNAEDNSYTTWLPTDVYLGGKYHFHDMLDFGALYRMEFYRKSLMHSFTVSANSDLTDWATAHLSYSMMDNKYNNIGLGITLRGAFLQYYLVTDNLLALMPQSTRNVNIRMGCNLVFGYKEIKSESLF